MVDSYGIVIRKKVFKQMKNYKKKNSTLYKSLKKELYKIAENPFDLQYISVERYPPYKRAKVGKYRICFKIVDGIIYISKIDKRNRVYR